MALWRPTRGGCSGLLLLAVVTLHVHAAGLPMSEHQKIAHSIGFSGRPMVLRCGEQLKPWFPVSPQRLDDVCLLISDKITSAISRG